MAREGARGTAFHFSVDVPDCKNFAHFDYQCFTDLAKCLALNRHLIGIYILDPGTSSIELFSFATRQRTLVARLQKRPRQWTPGLAVSPDQGSILVVQEDPTESDIMLVENFR